MINVILPEGSPRNKTEYLAKLVDDITSANPGLLTEKGAGGTGEQTDINSLFEGAATENYDGGRVTSIDWGIEIRSYSGASSYPMIVTDQMTVLLRDVENNSGFDSVSIDKLTALIKFNDDGTPAVSDTDMFNGSWDNMSPKTLADIITGQDPQTYPGKTDRLDQLDLVLTVKIGYLNGHSKGIILGFDGELKPTAKQSNSGNVS